MHPMNRSGIAALSDVKSAEWQAMYYLLEKEQHSFRAKEARFRSPEYKWARDPLHSWSRVWEYPYAYHHLKCRHAQEPHGTVLRAADIGSGVTFFPFAVARLGYYVTCVDVDPVVGVDLPKAIELVDQEPGQVDVRLCGDEALPLADAEMDVVCCISVLEHVKSPEFMVAEIMRILKPGGLFILTVDLDMRGDSAMGSEEYSRLMGCLQERFSFHHPVRTVHPLNVLASDGGPFPMPTTSLWRFLAKQGVRRLTGRPFKHRVPFRLTVEGMVLSRRDENGFSRKNRDPNSMLEDDLGGQLD
jgi:SAM-dependent methyltransferase